MVMGSLTQDAEVVVIGGGPGGYVAAIRLADLGKEVVLVEERESLGGVCLTEGCIPSKVLINVVDLGNQMSEAKKMGLTVKDMQYDLGALRKWTDSVVTGLTKGVAGLLKKRGVEVIHGRAQFKDNQTIVVDGGKTTLSFKHCVIATGSRINELPAAYDLPLWSSADALKLPELPERLLVVGGGYIGLEMGLVYAGLGSRITMVEFFNRLLLGADEDLAAVMVKNCQKRFEKILVDSKVEKVEKSGSGYIATVDNKGSRETIEADQVLVSIGRRPNTDNLGLDNTDVKMGERGLITVDDQGRTSVPTIYAIGDIVPGPALAHKASREAKVTAEAIADHISAFDNRAIPAVVFTDPEIAWTGLTEREATEQGVNYMLGKFPLRALGRARTMGRSDGFVKILADPDHGLVLGVGMVGPHVSEMIAEATLAMEMGATLEDLMVTIHPHPTISESIMEAAEVAAGSPIHINPAPGSGGG